MDDSCTVDEAVSRAQRTLEIGGGEYWLGTGDYHPIKLVKAYIDLPWTTPSNELKVASDCAGFAISYCWKLKRHRPGFNTGSWSSVEDDINVNSIMEDAAHKKELAQNEVFTPIPGDLLCYPSFNITSVDGDKVITNHRFIGHVGIIEECSKYTRGRYDLITIIQCHGPNGFKPGVVRTDGSLFMHHDSVWPKSEHKTRIIRMRER